MTAHVHPRRSPFLVGLNYPWAAYGWDFGPTPYGEGIVRRDAKPIAEALDTLAESKITVLRWFVGFDGRNLPSPGPDIRRIAAVRHYEGLGSYLERTASDAEVNAAMRPKPAFLEDLHTLAKMVSARGMKLLPTFISSTFLTPAEKAHVQDDYVARGRTAFIFGNEALPKKRFGSYVCGVDDSREDIGATKDEVHAFVENALAPLVDAIPSDQVLAWDVMNEPEWCVRDTPYTVGHAGALLHPWMLLTYLNAAIRCVARRGRDVSVGFVDGRVDAWFPETARLPGYAAWLDATLEDFPDVTYYHQHHHYPRWAGKPGDASVPPKALPHVAEFGLGARPTLLGEYQMRFAAGIARGAQAAADHVRKVATWPDANRESDADDYLTERLTLARDKGYAGALGWAGPGDPKNGQSPYADGEASVARALAQLARFSLSP